MTTRAGMKLLEGIKCPDRPHAGVAPSLNEVAAIEAEAVAAERARIRAEVEGLPGLDIDMEPGRMEVPGYVNRAAVLAAIQESRAGGSDTDPSGLDPNMDYERRDAMLDVVRRQYGTDPSGLDVEAAWRDLIEYLQFDPDWPVAHIVNEHRLLIEAALAARSASLDEDRLATLIQMHRHLPVADQAAHIARELSPSPEPETKP